jgi:hypothetical protein
MGPSECLVFSHDTVRKIIDSVLDGIGQINDGFTGMAWRFTIFGACEKRRVACFGNLLVRESAILNGRKDIAEFVPFLFSNAIPKGLKSQKKNRIRCF